MGIREKIKEIEEELSKTKKNKATEKHIGLLTARLAKLKREMMQKSKGGGSGFAVKKSGDATVALIGFPSVGKSSLLSALTGKKSEAAHYAFTTLSCIPGTLIYKKAKIQILDLPGIIEGAHEGKGRGREVIAAARSSDLILMLAEYGHPEQFKKIERELYEVGIRLNQQKPNIKISKKSKGGIVIHSSVKLTKISAEEIKGALSAYGIFNADVSIHEDVELERFIDAIESNRAYIPALKVFTKADLGEERLPGYIYISVFDKESIEKLKEEIYRRLNLIRVYTKRKGEEADLEEPLIIKKGSTIATVCEKLHRDLKENFRYALVWGKSVKFPGQRVGLEHQLEEGDVVQIVAR